VLSTPIAAEASGSPAAEGTPMVGDPAAVERGDVYTRDTAEIIAADLALDGRTTGSSWGVACRQATR